MFNNFFQRNNEKRKHQAPDNPLKPEADFYMNGYIHIADLEKSLIEHTLVVGRVIRWDSYQEQLYVNMGNGIIGYIPLEEISIYDINFNEGYSKVIAALIGKKICCYVTSVDIGKNTCVLSRKESMLSALQDIKENYMGTVLNGYIQNVANFGVFIDIGRGITGMVNIQELTNSRINSAKNIATKNTHMKVLLAGIKSDDSYKFELSHKKCFGSLEDNLSNYHVGDVIMGTLCRPISEYDPLIRKGYFVQITPVVSGITHIDADQYEYWANRKLRICGITGKGLILELIPEKIKT